MDYCFVLSIYNGLANTCSEIEEGIRKAPLSNYSNIYIYLYIYIYI